MPKLKQKPEAETSALFAGLPPAEVAYRRAVQHFGHQPADAIVNRFDRLDRLAQSKRRTLAAWAVEFGALSFCADRQRA